MVVLGHDFALKFGAGFDSRSELFVEAGKPVPYLFAHRYCLLDILVL